MSKKATASTPAEPSVTVSASGLLYEASLIVDGSRQSTHGDKERSFAGIAALWNTYIQIQLGHLEIQLSSSDVAVMMVLLKISRQATGRPVRDHFVDMAGYAGLAGELSLKPE